MLPEQLKTITCPICSNVNPVSCNNCIKCGMDLKPIKQALVEQGLLPEIEATTAANSETREKQPEHAQERPKNIEATPLMVPLQRGTFGKLTFIVGGSFLIRGMSEKKPEITTRFFKRLEEKDLKNITISTGELSVDIGSHQQESREYYFVRKDIDVYTYLLMALHIVSIGPDLYIEWRNYYHKHKPYNGWWWLLIVYGGIIYTLYYLLSFPNILKGFQNQENEMFRLSVRTTLEEAVDQAGISKSLIQQEGFTLNFINHA